MNVIDRILSKLKQNGSRVEKLGAGSYQKNEDKRTSNVRPAKWVRNAPSMQDRALTEASKFEASGVEVEVVTQFNPAVYASELQIGNFKVCEINGQATVIAKARSEKTGILIKAMQHGIAMFRCNVYCFNSYPILYTRLLIPTDVENRNKDIVLKGGLFENAGNPTDGDLQEWIRALQRSPVCSIILLDETLEITGNQKLEIRSNQIAGIINSMNSAQECYRKIPEANRNFNLAASEFFQKIPEPFW